LAHHFANRWKILFPPYLFFEHVIACGQGGGGAERSATFTTKGNDMLEVIDLLPDYRYIILLLVLIYFCMEKQLNDIIEQYKKSGNTLESYQAISSFVELVFQNDSFIEYTQNEGERINLEQRKLNADKGDRSKKWNEYRDKKHRALHELDPHFPLQNLYHVYEYLKPENATYGIDFLYANSSPDEPMREQDKKEYLMLLNKTYKNILPFIKEESNEAIVEEVKVVENNSKDIKYKSFDMDTGILTIGNFEIDISKTQYITIDFELLAYICIDNAEYIQEESYYKKIFKQRLEQEYNPNNKADVRKFADSANSINRKIEKETNSLITKFLIANFHKDGYVKINPKYL